MILAKFISTVHFLKFSNFVQTLMQMKKLSILLDIKLLVMSTSQLFWKRVHLTTKYHCGIETSHCWIFMFRIVISETNYSNKEKEKKNNFAGITKELLHFHWIRMFFPGEQQRKHCDSTDAQLYNCVWQVDILKKSAWILKNLFLKLFLFGWLILVKLLQKQIDFFLLQIGKRR